MTCPNCNGTGKVLLVGALYQTYEGECPICNALVITKKDFKEDPDKYVRETASRTVVVKNEEGQTSMSLHGPMRTELKDEHPERQAEIRVLAAALAWDESPGDPELCLELSEACGELKEWRR